MLERERCNDEESCQISKERNEGNRNVIQVREGNESVSRKGNPAMQQQGTGKEIGEGAC